LKEERAGVGGEGEEDRAGRERGRLVRIRIRREANKTQTYRMEVVKSMLPVCITSRLG
jgi:hypothetical protein